MTHEFMFFNSPSRHEEAQALGARSPEQLHVGWQQIANHLQALLGGQQPSDLSPRGCCTELPGHSGQHVIATGEDPEVQGHATQEQGQAEQGQGAKQRQETEEYAALGPLTQGQEGEDVQRFQHEGRGVIGQ